ncbi:MAG: lysophospholipase [Clostridiales bacterium]|nr:lysophospholipase [Clostridiales bacterium]
MKILMYGDSITDACWNRNSAIGAYDSYGVGYVRSIAGALIKRNPKEYTVINRGIGGNRIVDLYARIKADVWNHEPDVLSILIGINDIWHEIGGQNGVDIDRFEKVYRMLLEDTLARLPNLKIILCEPFVLEGYATKENLEKFLEIKEYAKVVKKLAKEYGAYFVPLQEDFEKKAKEYGAGYYLFDGVHPNIAGAELIADKWLKLFDEEVNK